ncbi:tetratricopeptide repeat protein 31, partial [Gastrophryne carolinensis]
MDLVDSYLDDDDDDEYYYYNEEDDDDYDDEDDDERSWKDGISRGTYCGFQPSFLAQHYAVPTRPHLTPEEADRNARKLLEEEEREKERANKKRLKKKRQKDRRRQQKLQEASKENAETPPNANRAPPGDEEASAQSSASEEDLDLGSTFVLKAQKKMAAKPRPERRERAKERPQERAQERPKGSAPQRSQERAPPAKPHPAPPRPVLHNNIIKMDILERYKIQESMDLANIGNNMANSERFSESLQLYTEALKINPSEYRFLGNRSYSYERLGQYTEALRDAELALELKPGFLKGYFRKGKALKGLKRYSEAIAAFQQVLVCDVNHVEAAQEITQCQKKLKESITSTRVKILSNAPLTPPATPPAPPPGQNQKVFVSRNIYNKKSTAAVDPKPPATTPPKATPSKFFPIWVGNVTTKITEDILSSIFEPIGPVHSIRVLHGRTCAFINYTNKEAAE